MPEHRQRALLSPELDKVVDKSVDHSVGQGVLFVKEYPERSNFRNLKTIKLLILTVKILSKMKFCI